MASIKCVPHVQITAPPVQGQLPSAYLALQVLIFTTPPRPPAELSVLWVFTQITDLNPALGVFLLVLRVQVKPKTVLPASLGCYKILTV